MGERMGVARTGWPSALGTQDRRPGSRGFCADVRWKHGETAKDGERERKGERAGVAESTEGGGG